MQVFFSDFYELLERFSIMTIDGNISDNEAMEYCRQHTTPELYAQFEKTIAGHTDRPENKDTLQEYLKQSIALYPCNQDGKPLVKTYNEKHEQINAITDARTLQDWKQKGVTRFSFYPKNNRLIVIDLDNSDQHANKANGINAFLDFAKGIDLTERNRAFLSDFPFNFPCYVETPHNGIHLYFNSAYIPSDWNADTKEFNARNIEVKYNTQATAGGSIRNGKEYILHGELANAPRMTTDLINAFTKWKPQRKPTAKRYNFDTPKNGKWNETPNGIISKALELYANDTPHYFVLHTAVLFHKAGFTESDALQAIEQTPQHLERKDQYDTQTTIHSIFN